MTSGARAEALRNGADTYVGRSCKRQHTVKSARTGECWECRRDRLRAWQHENKNKMREYRRAYRVHNKETCRRASAAWLKAHPDVVKTRLRDWKQKNPERVRFHDGLKRAAKAKRTVAWANLDKIAEVYVMAKFAEELTLQPHHVDHVIPLRGKLISGLHVETNLRVIPGADNLRKHNRFTPYAEAFDV